MSAMIEASKGEFNPKFNPKGPLLGMRTAANEMMEFRSDVFRPQPVAGEEVKPVMGAMTRSAQPTDSYLPPTAPKESLTIEKSNSSIHLPIDTDGILGAIIGVVEVENVTNDILQGFHIKGVRVMGVRYCKREKAYVRSFFFRTHLLFYRLDHVTNKPFALSLLNSVSEAFTIKDIQRRRLNSFCIFATPGSLTGHSFVRDLNQDAIVQILAMACVQEPGTDVPFSVSVRVSNGDECVFDVPVGGDKHPHTVTMLKYMAYHSRVRGSFEFAGNTLPHEARSNWSVNKIGFTYTDA